MINTINEAINRKLNSISFTTIIKGTVESLEPLKVRISNKIVIGLSFIEPRSLGIDDSSPSPALPLVVGEEIEMVRYNNGQRFYVLGKAASGGTVNYNDLQNKPILNTNNTASQSISSNETIGGTIKLHKISKTGSYNDLRDKPTIPQSDWNQTNESSLDYIKNKPTIPAAQIQSDWNQTNTSSLDYIKNKPNLDVYLQYEVIEDF